MGSKYPILLLAVYATAPLGNLTAGERATATGKVVDAEGKPVEHATVLVYEAGVKKGYSVFCPTCYTDCGKRSSTDADGRFTIGGLSPDLLFTLLAGRGGYFAALPKESGSSNTTPLAPCLHASPPTH